MKAGRPGTSLPSPRTVSHDIKAAFKSCCESIDKILKVSLQICFIDVSFNLSIGILQAPTFFNRCVDIPKSPGICRLDSAFAAQRKDFSFFT